MFKTENVHYLTTYFLVHFENRSRIITLYNFLVTIHKDARLKTLINQKMKFDQNLGHYTH